MNRTVVAHLATLRVKPENQRKRLGDLFAKLDASKGGAGMATVSDVMNALAEYVEQTPGGGNPANGHDLQASGAFAQHGA